MTPKAEIVTGLFGLLATCWSVPAMSRRTRTNGSNCIRELRHRKFSAESCLVLAATLVWREVFAGINLRFSRWR